jgi:type IV pilus assembly protein PilM
MLSLGRNTSDGSVGLDIDGDFVAAVQLDDGRLGRAASRELEPGIIRDGEVADPDKLGDVLRDFFKAEELPRRVHLGVANQQIVVRHLEMPRIPDAAERDAAVRFQTAEAVAMPLGDAIIDYQQVGESQASDGTPRERILVVAARVSMVEKLVDAVRRAGLKPEGIDLSAFALVRALAAAGPGAEARVYCHLGGVANVTVARGPICLFTRPLAAQWHEGSGAAEALAEEMRLSIEYYRAQAEAPVVSDVVVSGPGAHAEKLVDRFGELIGLPTVVAEPLGAVEHSAMPGHEDPYRHTVSLGLAMGAAA